MKGLSTEEKAKAYDEAIERAKEMIKAMTNIGGVAKVDDIQYLFPELKESEDEQIRKELIQYFSTFTLETFAGLSPKKIIAWLEKQGDKKPQGKSALEAANEEKVDNQNCVKSTDKVKPKFKVGDVIRLKGTAATYTIKRVTDTKYYTNGWSCGIERCEEDYELVKQKQAWSEDDERILVEMLKIFNIEKFEGYNIGENNEDALKFLKSLKDRYTWKPSDEQMQQLGWIAEQNEHNLIGKELMTLYKDLKKLKG